MGTTRLTNYRVTMGSCKGYCEGTVRFFWEQHTGYYRGPRRATVGKPLLLFTTVDDINPALPIITNIP